MLNEEKWYVYIITCNDQSLYTGITKSIKKRLEKHACGKGAKYTKGRLPVKLVYKEIHSSHSKAASREFEIKSMTRAKKIKLFS
ncbi:MAG: hypothetical protein CBC38_06395 [Gammaproteobacteria bacterium TMED78]|nr:MAG: hypothetical protein CBC38_06395 [Gammaproteobacteria bacterium TMED78]